MTRRPLTWLLLLTLLGAASTAARAQDEPWRLPAWSTRALVKVTGGVSPAIDVAAVRLIHAGLAQPSGNDYRILDAAGQSVPYQITYHHPGQESLLSFRYGKAGEIFSIYWGNPQAGVDPMRALVDDKPGSGPPRAGPAAGGWIPRTGLVLVTMRRPEQEENPMTPAQLADYMARSGGLDGAVYTHNVSDSVNPFGDSDYYISSYRGWINVPQAGRYGFCTASNEGSFSFLNGKELVHWPGRHTEQRGKFGEKNSHVELAAGLHYLEYLHEEVLLYQCAFLGWQKPGEERFSAIPNDAFPQPAVALVQAYQSAPGGPAPMPRVTLQDSIWPRGRAQGQYTRCHFEAVGADLRNWEITWSFGDGQSAAGPKVDHVYLTLGPVQVVLRAQSPQGQVTERRYPLTIFSIDHGGVSFPAGKRDDYLPIVSAYQQEKLPTPALLEYAHFQGESGALEAAQQAAKLVLARPDAGPEAKVAAGVLAAGDAGSASQCWAMEGGDAKQLQQVAQQLQDALDKERGANKLELAARLVRHVGVRMADLTQAESFYARAEEEVRGKLHGRLQDAFRQATIAVGDAHLAAGLIDQAAEDYRTAEALALPPIPAEVRTARVGAFPEAVNQYLDKNKLDMAWTVVEDWRDQFPSDQIEGVVFFYAGKVELLRKRYPPAIGQLKMAIELATGSQFEAEARFLLAQAYRDSGNAQKYRATLETLIRSGLGGPFREQALRALGTPDPVTGK